MRVMVFGIATEDSDKGEPPTAEAFAAMDRFMEVPLPLRVRREERVGR